MDLARIRGVVLRVLSGPLSNFHDLAADDATTALIINVITAVGQFQRDLQNELTAEGIAAAEAEGRYRGRPATLAGTQLQHVREAYRDQGASSPPLPASTASAGSPSAPPSPTCSPTRGTPLTLRCEIERDPA